MAGIIGGARSLVSGGSLAGNVTFVMSATFICKWTLIHYYDDDDVTLCDPIWQVTSRSSEVGFPPRRAISPSAFTFLPLLSQGNQNSSALRMRSGVLSSISSKQRSAIRGRPLPERTDFGPTANIQTAEHTKHKTYTGKIGLKTISMNYGQYTRIAI